MTLSANADHTRTRSRTTPPYPAEFSDSHAFPGVRQLAAAQPRPPIRPIRSLVKHPTPRRNATSTSASAAAPRLRRVAGANSPPVIWPTSKIPVATQLIISNRSACRLEMPESYRKQTTATRSNRHKCRHPKATSSRPHPIARALMTAENGESKELALAHRRGTRCAQTGATLRCFVRQRTDAALQWLVRWRTVELSLHTSSPRWRSFLRRPLCQPTSRTTERDCLNFLPDRLVDDERGDKSGSVRASASIAREGWNWKRSWRRRQFWSRTTTRGSGN